MAKLFAIILFLTSFMYISTCQSYPKHLTQIKKFIQNQLNVDMDHADKFSVKQFPNTEMYNIQIQMGRKTITLVIRSAGQTQQFKIVLLQEVAKFGNQKTFLNIRTSKGSKQDIKLIKQKVHSQKQPNFFKQYDHKLIPSKNSLPLDKQNLQEGEAISKQQLYEQIKKFVLFQFPMFVVSSIKQLQQNKKNEFKIQGKMGGAEYLITVGRKYYNNRQQLEIRNLKLKQD